MAKLTVDWLAQTASRLSARTEAVNSRRRRATIWITALALAVAAPHPPIQAAPPTEPGALMLKSKTMRDESSPRHGAI
jgi:hypothetical protein